MDLNSLGLLILRIGFAGIIAIRHGLPKLLDFSNKMHSFPDPLGIGSSTINLSLTIGAELVCGLLVVIGLFTRLATIPLVIVMGVAFFIVHGADPFQKKELALLFLLAFSAILAAGPGRFSVDFIFRKQK